MSADLTGWFTQDSSGSISGPFSTTQVKAKLEDSTIDGLTLVWTNDARYAGDFPDQQDILFPTDTAVQWKALHAVSSVKAELQSADSDDQSDGEDNVDNVAPAARQAGNAGAEDASIDPSAMVTAPADGMFYYAVASSGEQAGPVSADAFSSLIAAGYVDATTVVWAPGMPSWVPLASVDTLAPLLQPASAGAGASEDGVSGHKRRRAGVADKTGSSQDDAARGAKRPKSKSKQNDKPFTSPWILVQGLPPDVTEAELVEHFRKAGIIMLDVTTKEPVISIQRRTDGSNDCSGDALICFLKQPSVELAVTLYDGVELRDRAVLTVTPAPRDRIPTWHSKPATGDKFHKPTAEEQAAKFKALEQQAELSWAEEGDDVTGLKVITLKHIFAPEEVAEPGFMEELEESIVSEAEKFGEIDKLAVFSKHPDGVVTIKFRTGGAATAAIKGFHGRSFGGSRVECEFWDGRTDFSKTVAAAASEEERLDEFGAWLEGGSDGEAENS